MIRELVREEAPGSRLYTTQIEIVLFMCISSADDVEGKCKIQSSSVLCIDATLLSPSSSKQEIVKCLFQTNNVGIAKTRKVGVGKTRTSPSLVEYHPER